MRMYLTQVFGVNRRAPPARSAIVLLVAMAALAPVLPARAACTCICVGGQNRPLCSEVTDIEPLCPPKVCLRAPQSTRPLDGVRIQPLFGSLRVAPLLPLMVMLASKGYACPR